MNTKKISYQEDEIRKIDEKIKHIEEVEIYEIPIDLWYNEAPYHLKK